MPVPHQAAAQELTGALIGTVKDTQDGVVPGAIVRVSSPALMGGSTSLTTNEKGQLRFPALPPGRYVIDIEVQGFKAYHEADLRIGAGATIERTVILDVAGVEESLVVEGAGSRIEARGSGFETRFGPDDLKAIPVRRFSMFDFVRAAPGVSATSPGSGSTNSVSAFGSGANENTFLIDGTNFTCPCSGEARSEPGVDFIQEVQVQSVGASAEFGSMQGAVINAVTRQGGDRFLYDASYYGQAAGLTSQPVLLPYRNAGGPQSGYERGRYRDFTTNLGGPAIRDRLWFFAGYQYLRDYDSQPGTDPAFPRTYEQDKVFAKLTWRLAPGLQLLQSFHNELWVNPELPTLVKPFEATQRRHASVPAMTFGHLTHTFHPTRYGTCGLDDSCILARTTRALAVSQRQAASNAPPASSAAHRKPSADSPSFAPPARQRSTTTSQGCWAPTISGGSAGRWKEASITCPRSSRPVSGTSITMVGCFKPSRAIPRSPAVCSSRPPGS